MYLTAIVSITATRDRLQIWLIAKNRTDRRERRFHSHSERAVKECRLTRHAAIIMQDDNR
jgi:hypothetical protein